MYNWLPVVLRIGFVGKDERERRIAFVGLTVLLGLKYGGKLLFMLVCWMYEKEKYGDEYMVLEILFKILNFACAAVLWLFMLYPVLHGIALLLSNPLNVSNISHILKAVLLLAEMAMAGLRVYGYRLMPFVSQAAMLSVIYLSTMAQKMLFSGLAVPKTGIIICSIQSAMIGGAVLVEELTGRNLIPVVLIVCALTMMAYSKIVTQRPATDANEKASDAVSVFLSVMISIVVAVWSTKMELCKTQMHTEAQSPESVHASLFN